MGKNSRKKKKKKQQQSKHKQKEKQKRKEAKKARKAKKGRKGKGQDELEEEKKEMRICKHVLNNIDLSELDLENLVLKLDKCHHCRCEEEQHSPNNPELFICPLDGFVGCIDHLEGNYREFLHLKKKFKKKKLKQLRTQQREFQRCLVVSLKTGNSFCLKCNCQIGFIQFFTREFRDFVKVDETRDDHCSGEKGKEDVLREFEPGGDSGKKKFRSLMCCLLSNSIVKNPKLDEVVKPDRRNLKENRKQKKRGKRNKGKGNRFVFVSNFPSRRMKKRRKYVEVKENLNIQRFGEEKKWTGSTFGLNNLGNSCFFNSLIQCILATKPLAEFFVDWRKIFRPEELKALQGVRGSKKGFAAFNEFAKERKEVTIFVGGVFDKLIMDDFEKEAKLYLQGGELFLSVVSNVEKRIQEEIKRIEEKRKKEEEKRKKAEVEKKKEVEDGKKKIEEEKKKKEEEKKDTKEDLPKEIPKPKGINEVYDFQCEKCRLKKSDNKSIGGVFFKFRRCKRCKFAYYCQHPSVQSHQRTHWSVHKHYCFKGITREEYEIGRAKHNPKSKSIAIADPKLKIVQQNNGKKSKEQAKMVSGGAKTKTNNSKKQKKGKRKSKKSAENSRALSKSFNYLFNRKFVYDVPSVFRPATLLYEIMDRAHTLCYGHQEDSHELLNYLRFYLQMELKGKKAFDNIIDRTFGIKFKSTVVCLDCMGKSRTDAYEYELSVPINKNHNFQLGFEKENRVIEMLCTKDVMLNTEKQLEYYNSFHPSKKGVTLVGCLLEFFKQDSLQGVNKYCCERCMQTNDGEKTEAIKQVSIFKLPKILTIHLKRFKKETKRVSKNETNVRFPLEVDLKSFLSNECKERERTKYRLYGVVDHSGGLHSGHYICYVQNLQFDKTLNPRRTQWYVISDSGVSKITERNMLGRARPYILFYERI